MHPTPTAKEPGGTSRAVAWFRRVVQNIRERTLIAGSGVKLDYQADGTIISIKRGGGKGGDGVNFRGIWVYTESYAVDDWVFFDQDYLVAEFEDSSYEYSGLYRLLVPYTPGLTTAVAPGTDTEIWELISEGPRAGETIKKTGETDIMRLEGNGVFINGDNLVFSQNGSYPSVGNWLLKAIPTTGEGGEMFISGGAFTGSLQVRDIYVSQGGVLLQAKAIITEPTVVDVSTL